MPQLDLARYSSRYRSSPSLESSPSRPTKSRTAGLPNVSATLRPTCLAVSRSIRLKHIDPIGTVLVPLGLFTLGGFIFGWAKPVPVAFRNLKQPKRDMVLVAAAGPAVNFLMAIGWTILLAIILSVAEQPRRQELVVNVCYFGISIQYHAGNF